MHGYGRALSCAVASARLDVDADCRSGYLSASLRIRVNESMKHGAIISRAESLQILKNDLHKAALAWSRLAFGGEIHDAAI